MASNPGSNGGGQFYRRQIYAAQNSSSSSSGPGSLPPASELLSPSPAGMSYPNKVRHPLHSVASPSIGPPSPYLGPHNSYQTLTEPGTPAFLNPASVDPIPSPSYESIASPASNNHMNQSAGSTKPSTPMTECRASPIPNGIYNSGAHYPPHPSYYQPSHQQAYQRLPSVDTLPSTSSSTNYYPNNSNQMPPPSQSLHHSNVYVRPIDRPSHPLPPNIYAPQNMASNPDGSVSVYPTNEDYINGPTPHDYYPDPYAQPPPTDPAGNYNSYPPNRPYPSPTMKQPMQQHLRQPLQRQVVYQQQQSMQGVPMAGPPPHHVYIQPPYPTHQQPPANNQHHVVGLYENNMTDQRPPPVPYIPPQVPPQSPSNMVPIPNGTSQPKSDGVVTNATQSPIMSTAPPANNPPETKTQPEKPKKPAPKRIRKNAAQLKAEKQQQQANQQTIADELKPTNGGDPDTSSLLMPPPKVAQAPSVVAAAAKAMHSGTTPTNSNQSTPQKPDMSPQQLAQSPLSGQQESIVDLPSNQQQQSTAPKRQRSASQRAQQQKARLQKQKEFELLKAREEREYLTKFIHLRRTVRALVFKNGALADEVARLKMQIDICREERKMVAKRVQHYERNRIRRQQTHERKALARAAAAQQQLEQKSTDTAEDDENSRSIDVVLPLNDSHHGQQQRHAPTNFHSLTEHSDAVLSLVESMQKSKTSGTPRKRSRAKNPDSNEHAPPKRRRSNGSTTPKLNTKTSAETTSTELKLQIPRQTNPLNLSQVSATSSMDFSPVILKQPDSVFMSPMEEMKSSPINNPLPTSSVASVEAKHDESKDSPLTIQINTSSASTPTKPSSAQLTPTGRKKSGDEIVGNGSGTNDSIRKRFSARLNKGQQRQPTPPTPTPNEDIISLRTRSASRSQPSSTLSPKPAGRATPLTALTATNMNNTPSTSSSFSITSSTSPIPQLNTSSMMNTTIPAQVSPLPTRETFTRFPANFLERSETPAAEDPHEKSTDEPRENDFDRPISELPVPSKVTSERHLRSNSSTTDGGLGVESRQRTNSRTSRRPPRHSLTPSSLADSDIVVSNSASPIPHSDGNPSNTPTVVTRRKAAEIATSSTTPTMKTRSKSKIQGS